MTTGTPTAAQIRPATADDAEAILQLHLLRDLANLGEPSTTVDELEADLANLTIRSAVLPDEEGRFIAHGWLDYEDGHSKTWGDVTVRPGADPGVAELMLDWLLETSCELAPGLPAHVFADSNERDKITAYSARGGTEIRRFCRMRIELEPPVMVPPLAVGVAIRSVERADEDLRTVHRIVDTAFLDHFAHEATSYESWLALTADGSRSDLSLWWLASVDGQPAAVLYGCKDADGGHIDTLGTLREFRGRGIGRALMLTAFAEFARRELLRVTLGVDATNPTGARELYESLGMIVSAEGLRYEIYP